MEINAMFRDATLQSRDFQGMLAKEAHLVNVLLEKEPLMAHANWRLTGDTFEDAIRYPAFDEDGQASTPAIAVLTERARGKKRNATHAAIWNVEANDGEGAAISCHVSDTKVLPDHVTLDIDARSCFQTAGDLVDIIQTIVATFQPLVVEASPTGYFEHQVFNDKPGVGWMLYLPRIITAQQVPEARALIPVPAAGKRQTGTIIVSVTDAVFSTDNPKHVEIANRIEIRLADQDLLPAYVEL